MLQPFRAAEKLPLTVERLIDELKRYPKSAKVMVDSYVYYRARLEPDPKGTTAESLIYALNCEDPDDMVLLRLDLVQGVYVQHEETENARAVLAFEIYQPVT